MQSLALSITRIMQGENPSPNAIRKYAQKNLKNQLHNYNG